jgi:two-component system cell cycle sensor histidine kinase/response regulator CckA
MRGALRHSQAVLRAVLESPRDIVIFALDRDYRYLAFNENHARTIKSIWGVDIRVGAAMLEIIGRPDDRDKAKLNFDRALAGENFTVREEYGDERMQRRVYDNMYSPIRAEDGEIIGLTVYLTDITVQSRAQLELDEYRAGLEEIVKQRTRELETAHAQLLRAQKLESLGVLAGGVAHDFNNLLAIILGRIELALRTLATDHATRPHLDIVRETALEARMLTRQLVAYAGKGRFAVQAVNLSEMVESMSALLRASIRKSVALELELEAEPLVVQIDPTQARQVVLNLVANAAESIEGAGRVVVRTRPVDVDESLLRDACIPTDLPRGRHACLEVEDNGCGMDAAIRTKLFDPFFTTKVAGHGLGLAAVLGIVQSHHGTILLRTAADEGSRFSIVLPIVDEEAVVAQVLSPSGVPSDRGDFRGEGVALVVDDEHAVRAVTSEMLAGLGYEVLEAESGAAAVDIFKQVGHRVRVVLLDFTMPGLSGEQTLRELKALRADVDVIVLTGYTEDEARLRFVKGELAGFLTKPFMREEIIDVLRLARRTASRDA